MSDNTPLALTGRGLFCCPPTRHKLYTDIIASIRTLQPRRSAPPVTLDIHAPLVYNPIEPGGSEVLWPTGLAPKRRKNCQDTILTPSIITAERDRSKQKNGVPGGLIGTAFYGSWRHRARTETREMDRGVSLFSPIQQGVIHEE